MPDFAGAMRSGYEIGQSAGGRLSGVGMALKKVANRLRTQRETEEGVALLGRTERIKAKTKVQYPTPLEAAKAKYYTTAAEAGPKLTATETFRQDLRQAQTGTIDWEDLKVKYPEPSKQKAIEEVRVSGLPSVGKAPGFRYGTGGGISRLKSFISPKRAEIDKTTQKVINNIANQEDLNELLNNEDGYRAAGVDVKAVKEYFGVK